MKYPLELKVRTANGLPIGMPPDKRKDYKSSERNYNGPPPESYGLIRMTWKIQDEDHLKDVITTLTRLEWTIGVEDKEGYQILIDFSGMRRGK